MEPLKTSLEIWNLWPKDKDPRSLMYFKEWYMCTQNLPQVEDIFYLWLDICTIYESKI